MSQNNSKKKVGHITLFFNRHLNIFPDDFFITKNKNLVIKKNPFNEENAKNEPNNEDNIANNINNNTTTNFRKSIKNISNKIKFDTIFIWLNIKFFKLFVNKINFIFSWPRHGNS